MRSYLLMVIGLVTLLVPSWSWAQTIEHLTVALKLEADDTLLVTESYELSGKLKQPLERTILREEAPGVVPRRQWITDLKVKGDGVEWSKYHALDRTRVTVAKGASDLTLSYRLHRVVPASGRFEVTTLDVDGFSVKQLTVRLTPPDGVDEDDVSWDVSVLGDDGDDGFFEDLTKAPRDKTIDVGAKDIHIAYDIQVPPSSVTRPPLGDQLRTMVGQAGWLPYLAAVFLVLSLLLRFLPIGFVIGFTRLWHLVIVVPIVVLIAPDVIYFLRAGPLDDALAGLGIGIGYLALLGGFVWMQDRGLRQARREAFHIELALPVVLLFAFPVWNNPAALPFLPLLGLPVAIYWLRDDMALAFGAASHRIVEHVVTEGRVTLDALAKELGLSRRRLERILKQQPDLPLVADYAKGIVYSAAAAAQLAELAVCSNCGGATEVAGMDVVACPYCFAEYAQAAKHATERPVPIIVEAFARISEVLSVVLGFWGLAFGLAFAGFEGGFGAVVLLPVIVFGGVAYGAYLFAKALREGHGEKLLALALVGTGFFIVPLFAFLPLRRRRVALHFGRADASELKSTLEERGELAVAEVASSYQTTLAEATELARFLCATGALDAVYDRPRARLVKRAHFASIAHQGACNACGGTLGVIGGVVRCHYCRAAA